MDDDKGTSVVIVHSLKGRMLFEGISASLNTEKMNVDEILPESADSRKPVSKGAGRAAALHYFSKGKSVSKMCTAIDGGIRGKILRNLFRNK